MAPWPGWRLTLGPNSATVQNERPFSKLEWDQAGGCVTGLPGPGFEEGFDFAWSSSLCMNKASTSLIACA
jgi:hypothetical protein